MRTDHRNRWFAALFAVCLLAPAIRQAAAPAPADDVLENRKLAAAPDVPRTLDAAFELPSRIDAYLADHFGFRRQLVSANNWLRYRLFGEVASKQVVVGRNERLFLGTHNAERPDSLILDVCGVDVGDEEIARAADEIRALLQQTRAAGFRPFFLLVPTAPRLHAEDLPPALARRCADAVPSADRLFARLSKDPATQADVAYPVTQMLALKQSFDVIPRKHFHWAGEGPLRVAKQIARDRLGIEPSLELPLRADNRTSDLNRLVPGLGARSRIRAPDYKAAPVQTCLADSCATSIPLPPPLLAPLVRFQRPGAGRLLVVADSFGDEIAGTFVESFGDVLHLVTNLLPALAPAQRQQLADYLLQQYRPDVVLFVYHDGGFRSAARNARRALFPAAASD
jgi:hypothetical protein